MSLKQYIPNTITCLNLFSGSVALVFAFDGQLHIAALLVVIASVFDFLDGFSARLLKAYSPVGKELDSLADLVSFGLVPGVIILRYMQAFAPDWGPVLLGMNILPFTAFLIPVFSAVRLAVFNLDDKQSEEFIGLPTPANALFFISLPLLLQYGSEQSRLYEFFVTLTQNFYILFFLTVLSSFLLVSNLILFSLKFKNLRFSSNRTRYIFVLISILLLVLLGFFSLPFIIISYILVSMVSHYTQST